MLSECRVHVVLDGHDLLLIQKRHESRGRLVCQAIVFFGRRRGDQLRKIAIAVFLELQRRPGTIKFALQQAHFLFPGHRHVVHVLLVPSVVLPADARRPGLRRGFRLKPVDQVIGGRLRCVDRFDQVIAGVAPHAFKDTVQVVALRPDVADTCNPKVARIAGEILPRLPHERRNHRQLVDHPLFLFVG